LAAPVLSAILSGNQLAISWPTDVSGFVLQSADSLTNPTWSAVNGVANNSVTIAAGIGNRFQTAARCAGDLRAHELLG